MTQVIIIGLDGGTWDILLPLIKENKLPIMKKLIEQGVHGILESTIPPVTGPSWLSMATGRNPGKTGVIDFLNRKDDSYTLRSINSSDFQGKSFWDYLSNNGRKIGIINFPMLFPAYKINGFMISGLLASINEDYTYPKILKEKINEIAKEYQINLNYHEAQYNDIDLFIKDLNQMLEKKIKVIKYLIKEQNWELLFIVFSCTDWIQHRMWRYIDKKHPLYDPNISPKYQQEFNKFWQKIDTEIGNFLNSLGKDITLLIVSDHGFGSNNQTFNLTTWLEKNKYSFRKKSIINFKKDMTYFSRKRIIASFIKSFIQKIPLQNFLIDKIERNIMRKIATYSNSISVIKNQLDAARWSNNQIDYDRSKAFCLGHTIPFGAIYFNEKIVREKLQMRIVKDLRKIKDNDKKKVEIQIYDTKKLYTGEKNRFLPDIIFRINDGRCIIIQDKFDDTIFKNEPFSIRHTGSHRMNGIFLAYGKNIKKGAEINGAEIYDIFPTILHMFNVPIPKNIDGKILQEIFETDSEFGLKKSKIPNNR